MKQTTLPQGMHDKLFKRARVTYQIERAISDLLMDQGFNRIETPTLEHFEVFSDQVETSNYNLFDREGQLLSLRPDITSQIGRVIASTRVETPIKFSYSGKVFHYNEEMRGLTNEHTQAGVEIVGFPVQEAVEEALISAKKALEIAKVDDYSFELSHAAVLQTIFETLELSETDRVYLQEAILEKHITRLKEFTVARPSEFDGFISQLPFLFGDWQEVLAQARQLTNHKGILSALSDLELTILRLGTCLPRVTIDLGQLPTVSYYTGLMFKVFGDKVPDAFASGGRYDKLFERFGAKELTALGWTIDIDLVYQAVRDHFDCEVADD
ncbi:ATP phosphoribosyltransferase regulatory subunit [Streptococcus gallolyticus]|uniref:ATP phosphoribosyltransferase regulatory subunit n=1 Tax=Streptococcus hepaticus TaxID=3349163 RepID=UPI001C95D9DB|nr:ATP phosphoribosyltransferase regulatory subunit [Streptococcus gallolyticus]MBY5041314.1 ATP phosphoribosyltransferase regulatory subunit [Streptococcus gallolyticus]